MHNKRIDQIQMSKFERKTNKYHDKGVLLLLAFFECRVPARSMPIYVNGGKELTLSES